MFLPPGTLEDVDYKERIINYMADNKLEYTQDVDWTEVTSQPAFEGVAVGSCL